MAASFSVIIAPSALSCCLRHSTLRVRPVAKVFRSRATVAGMSARPVPVWWARLGNRIGGHGGVLPDPRNAPDPNQPVGPSRRPRPTASRLWRMWRMRRPRHRPVRTQRSESAHLVLRGHRARAPAVRVQPVGDVGAVGVVVHQFGDVDLAFDAELVGDLLEPLLHLVAALLGTHADRLGRDAAAGRAEFGDLRRTAGPARRAGRYISRPSASHAVGLMRVEARSRASAAGQSWRRSTGT